MNYFKIYALLVRNALYKNRDRVDGEYYESHHVKPKCMGGKYEVLLTAREHFILHLLLTKIYPNNSKLLYLFNMMFRVSEDQERHLPLSHWYEYRRKLFIEHHPSKQPKYRVLHISGMINDLKKQNKHFSVLYKCEMCLVGFSNKDKYSCLNCGNKKLYKFNGKYCHCYEYKAHLLKYNEEELKKDINFKISKELHPNSIDKLNKFKENAKLCLICNLYHTNKFCCSKECFEEYLKTSDNEYSKTLSSKRKEFIENNREIILLAAQKAANNRDERLRGLKILLTKRKLSQDKMNQNKVS